MKGMKKTSEEFQANNVYQVKNDVQIMNNMCTAPKTVVRKSKKVRKTSRVITKEIVSILMMILGIIAIILGIVELFFITNYQFYSQFIFMRVDAALIIMIAGFISFIWGIRLAWDS